VRNFAEHGSGAVEVAVRHFLQDREHFAVRAVLLRGTQQRVLTRRILNALKHTLDFDGTRFVRMPMILCMSGMLCHDALLYVVKTRKRAQSPFLLFKVPL
jgi:hypothetical protein